MFKMTQEPMSPPAQGLAILGSLVLIATIALLIKKGHLKSGYSILWFLLSFSILFLSLFNNILLWLSEFIGVAYAPALIFAVLFVGIILILIHFSVVIAKQDEKIKTLTQEIALIKVKFNKK
jgi:hypothetical protein